MIREAIVLAGGKAERLGEAAGGRPKALVRIGELPLLGYQVALLVRAGVDRLIVSCAAGQGPLFEQELADLGAEIVAVEEPEPLGRGGGLRFAAAARRDEGDVYALNGDELVDLTWPLWPSTTARAVRPRRSRSCRSSRTSASSTWRTTASPRLPREAAPPALGQLRRLRARRGGTRATSGARRPRDDDVPRARDGAKAVRLPPRGPLADGEHPEDLRAAAEHVAANPDWLGTA